MTNQRAIGEHAAGFVIPVGTQVVLQVTKVTADESSFRKPGSVGVIVESPPNNHHVYVLQFADGQTAEAYFAELALRRKEVDNELSQTSEDLRQYIIYCCQVGSKAYGLAHEESDDDLRGVYLPPARLHWSLYALPEQLEFVEGASDQVYWELEKFLRLALKANPNILETLWTPMVLFADETAEELRSIRLAFLSKHIYKTYSGYVLSQFRRMEKGQRNHGKFKPKHAMHLIRLLHSGISAVNGGEIMIDVSEHRHELLAIRRGSVNFEQIRDRAFELDRQFQKAFESTRLPEQPDFAEVDAFLLRARTKMLV